MTIILHKRILIQTYRLHPRRDCARTFILLSSIAWYALARSCGLMRKSRAVQTPSLIMWFYSRYVQRGKPRLVPVAVHLLWEESRLNTSRKMEAWGITDRQISAQKSRLVAFIISDYITDSLGFLGLGKTSSSNEFDLLLVLFTVFSSFSE